MDRKQSESITIPAKDSFRFLSAERISQPENGIQIVFSDPVSDTQDLKGLIEIPEIPSYIFQITDNKVNVYFEAGHLSKLTLKIHEGVKNNQGKALGGSHSISFGETEPETSSRNIFCQVPSFPIQKSCNSFPGCQSVCCRPTGYPHFLRTMC